MNMYLNEMLHLPDTLRTLYTVKVTFYAVV